LSGSPCAAVASSCALFFSENAFFWDEEGSQKLLTQ